MLDCSFISCVNVIFIWMFHFHRAFNSICTEIVRFETYFQFHLAKLFETTCRVLSTRKKIRLDDTIFRWVKTDQNRYFLPRHDKYALHLNGKIKIVEMNKNVGKENSKWVMVFGWHISFVLSENLFYLNETPRKWKSTVWKAHPQTVSQYRIHIFVDANENKTQNT